jgi:hypothetical protein
LNVRRKFEFAVGLYVTAARGEKKRPGSGRCGRGGRRP